MPDSLENAAILGNAEHRPAEFPVVRCLDLAAELLDHGLLAVTNSQHRHAKLENLVGGPRGIDIQHRGRAARQDNRPRRERRQAFARHLVERMNFAINAAFANAPRNQLGHLRSEIDNQNAVGHDFVFSHLPDHSGGR